MATNVRTLASGDYILCATGGADSGYGTYLAIYKRNSTAYNALLSADAASGNDGASLIIAQTVSNSPYWYNGTAASFDSGHPITNASGWVILAATKATGTVPPKIHVCTLSGPTWTHTAADTALANAAAGTGWRLGGWYDGSGYTTAAGDLYCLARWDASALADATLETFTSIAAIIAAAPTNLWILDQASTATAVTDYMASGADQSAIVGTSVTSGVTISNFDTTRPVSGIRTNLMLLGVG